MPEILKRTAQRIIPVVVLILFFFDNSILPAGEGIDLYYARYDIKSSKNQIVDENLLLVPAENEFRAENFSFVTLKGVISAAPGESKSIADERVRTDAIKKILVNQGLKSVKTKDTDTVISYEGVVKTPLNLLKNTYREEKGLWSYEVEIKFSPIAFPDKWETLGTKHRIKQVLSDFLDLFR